jgi:hydroxyacyl-ACP dehydratase HTD2-like protein with hotdog domain
MVQYSRPPVAIERLSLTPQGHIKYSLKMPHRNGTTHLIFEPLDFIARLASLVPSPRVNLTRYHGIFGHPVKGGFLPPVPRRMWAAGSLDVVRLLYLGLPAGKTSRIHYVELRSGKTGPLVFVGIDHFLPQNGFLCVREEQTLVYRTVPIEHAALPPAQPASVDVD